MTRHPGASAVLAFALVAVAGVFLRPATPIDETRYLAVAWEMWLSHDWLVPTKNFDLYTHKPPLLFWAINLVWSVTGVSEIAARLVGPGFAVATLMLTGRLARLLWPDDPGIGGRAVLALAGMLFFALSGGLTMFDAALACATVAGALALVGAVYTGRRRYWLGLGVALAAGGLIKGPVIVLHLAPVIALAPIWSRGRIGWRLLARGAGIAFGSGLALIAAWLVPAIVSGGPEYRDAILWTQSAGRMSSSFAHARPWWFLFAVLPALLFPWIAVPALWRSGLRQGWHDPAVRFCAIWVVSALLLFSLISGKQVHYLVPELPAAALIVGNLGSKRFSVVLPAAILGAVALIGIAAAVGLVPLGRASTLFEPRSALLAWGLLMIAVCIIAVRGRGLAGGATLTLGAILAFDLLFGLTAARESYDTHGIARAIAPYQADGIAFYGQGYHAEFNFADRFTAPVAIPSTPEDLTGWRRAHPDGVVVARLDKTHPPWPPHRSILFRNAPYAIWRASDASQQDLLP